jgi:hypothetical protein
MNEYPKYILKQGVYNEMPGPYKEITEDEFWHRVLIWGFSRDEEYRQILPDLAPDIITDKYMHPIHILYYQTEALAVMSTVVDARRVPWKFFIIGCRHEGATGYDTIRGDHSRTCPTCGLTWGWDSSD